MAPAAAEMLDALDASHMVVGIGDFVRGPRAIVDLPRLGGYDSPNVERLLELRIDLLVTTASDAAVRAHDRLQSLGIRVLALDTSTYDGVFASLGELGRALDRRTAAEEIAERMRTELSSIAGRVEGVPRRSVLFVVGRDPVYVAGPGSHIDEMISLAGGANVAGDTGTPYPRVSLEAVLERSPEVIIDTSDNNRSALRGRHVGDWGRWEFLPAVRDHRVYRVDPSLLVIPGIRLPEMTELMGRLIHPEIFGDVADADLVER